MKRILTLLLLVVSCSLFTAFAQDKHLIDSLEMQLKKHDATRKSFVSKVPKMFDTGSVTILINLSSLYFINNNDSSFLYAKEAFNLSEKMGYKKGIALAYQKMGWVYLNRDDYPEALKNLNAALTINLEIGNTVETFGCYFAIGHTYLGIGNLPDALKNYFNALKIAEVLGIKRRIANSYSAIASVYSSLGNFEEAKKYQLKSIEIAIVSKDKYDLASAYEGMADNDFRLKNYAKALEHRSKALHLMEEISDAYSVSFDLYRIGQIYYEQGQNQLALEYYLKSLKVAEDKDFKILNIALLNAVGSVYMVQKKYADAQLYHAKALSLSKEIGSLGMIETSYGELAALDSAKGNFRQAFEHYKLRVAFRDSLINKENTKKAVALQMNYDFGKKQDSINAVQAKKDAVATVELNKQKEQKIGLLIGLAIMVVFAFIFLRQRNNIKAGKKKSDELLLNILPSEVAEELKLNGSSDAREFDEATVMFTDFKDFTHISEKMTPSELVKEIDYCFSAFDNIIHKHGIEKIKTIGDAYMCAGGLPVANKTHAEDTVKAALEIRDFMANHNKEKVAKGELPFEIRIGINTGPVVAGIVGVKKFAYDIWGDTVNLASRMESSGKEGEVNISGSTFELVKDKFTCTHRGKIQTKNKGEVDMYFVSNEI